MKILERFVILMYDRSNSPTDIDLVNIDLLEKATVIECHPVSTGYTCRTRKACLVSSGVYLFTTYCTKHKHRESCRLRWNKCDGHCKITDTFWWYDLPGAKDATEEWKLQSGFYSDGSLTVMKDATLSKPPSTGLSDIQFSNTPNYISWSRKTGRYR